MFIYTKRFVTIDDVNSAIYALRNVMIDSHDNVWIIVICHSDRITAQRETIVETICDNMSLIFISYAHIPSTVLKGDILRCRLSEVLVLYIFAPLTLPTHRRSSDVSVTFRGGRWTATSDGIRIECVLFGTYCQCDRSQICEAWDRPTVNYT